MNVSKNNLVQMIVNINKIIYVVLYCFELKQFLNQWFILLTTMYSLSLRHLINYCLNKDKTSGYECVSEMKQFLLYKVKTQYKIFIKKRFNIIPPKKHLKNCNSKNIFDCQTKNISRKSPLMEYYLYQTTTVVDLRGGCRSLPLPWILIDIYTQTLH